MDFAGFLPCFLRDAWCRVKRLMGHGNGDSVVIHYHESLDLSAGL